MKTIISDISIYLVLIFFTASYAKTPVNVDNNIATAKVAATDDFDTTAFITVWETTTANESITIPTNASAVYDYTVDWGDGTIDTNVTGDATHTFATAGTHTIKINGNFPRIFFNNSGDRLKIKEVTQWGTIQWGLMASAFRGCENLDVTATDTPDLSNANNMTSMFFGCSSLVGNASFNSWDVSNIRFMFATFSRSSFNQPINNWNVSNVTNMQRMFSLTNFNQPLNSWNVSNVENMLGMFQDNTAFDQNLGSWDISSVTDMTDMFLNGNVSIENYDNTLTGWATLDTGETQIPTNINFNGGNSQYCSANLSRIDLINNYSWSISDGGNACTNEFFITTWETTADGESITIPTIGSGYNYSIDWGDGTLEAITTDAGPTHIYQTAGIYTISIGGSFPRIAFDNGGDRLKIKEVNQWGNIQWTNMRNAFHGCENLNITATDTPDLSNVTDMTSMLRNCTNLTDSSTFSTWDVSNIVNMTRMFRESNFNHPINTWNVSNVINMQGIFERASFNQPLNNWNVSNVANMRQIFNQNTAFNQDLGAWDISSVTAMNDIFTGTSLSVENYDNTLIGWARLDAGEMKIPANINFNGGNNQYCLGEVAQNILTSAVAVGGYNWSITDAGSACESDFFITEWQTTTANETITIPTTGAGYNYTIIWDELSMDDALAIDYNVTGNATHTFPTAGTHTIKIIGDFPRIYVNNTGDRTKIQKVTQWGSVIWQSMEAAFYGCENLTITATDTPNIANVTNMSFAFSHCTNLIGNPSFNTWDVSNVTTMEQLFTNTSFDQQIDNWDISSVSNLTDMFTGAELSPQNYDQLLTAWSQLDTAAGETQIPTDLVFDAGNSTYCLAEFYRNLLTTEVANGGFNWTINDSGLALTCDNSIYFVTVWETTQPNETITIPTNSDDYTYNYTIEWGDGTADFNVTGDISHVYATPSAEHIIRISGDFPAIRVNENSSQQEQLLEIRQWGTIQWESLFGAFRGCRELEVTATDIPDFSNLINMAFMFGDCRSLTGNTSFNNWDVSNVQSIAGIFENAINFNLDLDNWNTANVRNMSFAFKGATIFNGDISTWNTANVFTMRRMFRSATAFNGDISQWNTSNVQDMSDMLRETDFNQNLGAWDISSVTTMENMLFATRMSTDNYDDTLIGWETLDPGETRIPRNITFGAGNRRFCRSETQRQSLIDTYRWTISDGNINPNCSVVIAPKVYLQGAALNPNVGEENLMRDDLRVAGIIPVRSPYPDSILREATLFDVTGNDALVDWVWVELREATDNTAVIAAQSALLQRDGDVVDVDGTSPLSFSLIGNRNYFVTIKHRNHLGIISASNIRLTGTATTVDFTDGSTLTFGNNAQTNFGIASGIQAMWTGNVNGDTIVQYSGVASDTPDILSEVLNDPGNFLNFSTFVVNGYIEYDLNMDGSTQYSGTNPDTPIILQNVLAHPGNFLNFSTYQIEEQLPESNQ